jgi:hypothetical protein
MAGGSDPGIGGWLDHPMLVDFYFILFLPLSLAVP